MKFFAGSPCIALGIGSLAGLLYSPLAIDADVVLACSSATSPALSGFFATFGNGVLGTGVFNPGVNSAGVIPGVRAV